MKLNEPERQKHGGMRSKRPLILTCFFFLTVFFFLLFLLLLLLETTFDGSGLSAEGTLISVV